MTFMPLAVAEIELSSPPSDVPLFDTPASAARVLVRVHRAPIGFVEVAVDGGVIAWAKLAGAVERELHDALAEHLRTDGSCWGGDLETLTDSLTGECSANAPLADEPFISVVVCTRERPSELVRCLTALQRAVYPRFEVVVVDNAATTDDTATLVLAAMAEDPRVRLVTEPRPGLSRARNAGAAAAHGEIIAFTDDDVRVDEWWLEGLARGFARGRKVGCVTGLVAAADLTTPAQRHFDRRVFWSASCESRLVDMDLHRPSSPLFPYAAGQLGTGASMAFRRSALDAMGPFDEALGAGSPARGGEDLDAFVRVLRAGWAVAYEPAAVAWHAHRHDADGLRDQLYGYGVGLTAYLAKHLSNPRRAWEVARQMPRGLAHARGLLRRGEGDGRSPSIDDRGLRWAEVLGMVHGPGAYVRGRRSLRRLAA